MSQDAEPISKKVVVYKIPGMDAVEVRRDVAYGATRTGALVADIYYPPGPLRAERTPAIIFVIGYPDAGAESRLGCKFKEMGSYVSWAKLAAASGVAAITYTNLEPAADFDALLRYVRRDAAGLGVDENSLGLWACSGNVPLALSILTRENELKCAVLCYGYMLDLAGTGAVAEAARVWGFVNPCAGKSVADLPLDTPLFIARAGRDQMPGLNETIDGFLAEALARNLPVTFVNHAAAPHAFDLFDGGATSREIVRRILAFMRFHLLATP